MTTMMLDNSEITIDRKLDTSGLQCPLPILKAKAEIARMQAGEVLQVIATDRHAPIDFRVYCQSTGHEFLQLEESSENLTMLIRKVGVK
jgi:tRNA 2-thiouridine synthesizing protein A